MVAWWQELGLTLSRPRGDAFDWFELEDVWARSYAGRPRPPGWLQGKLEREACSTSENTLLRTPQGDLVAFFLTGRSDVATRHGLGLAVVPAWRGRSIGSQLVATTLEDMRATTGFEAMVCEIESDRFAFYAALGFASQSRHAHLRHTGQADTTRLVDGIDPAADAHLSWKRCAWDLTASTRRRCLVSDLGKMGLTREGPSWLAHWWTTNQLAPLAEELRRSTANHECLFLYGVDQRDPAFADLRQAGWLAAQPFERWVWSRDAR